MAWDLDCFDDIVWRNGNDFRARGKLFYRLVVAGIGGQICALHHLGQEGVRIDCHPLDGPTTVTGLVDIILMDIRNMFV